MMNKSLPYTSYVQSKYFLNDCSEFRGNSWHGTYEYCGAGRLPYSLLDSLPTDADYYVYSYATPIAWVKDDVVTIPEVKYSSTTSRQQTICRAYLNANIDLPDQNLIRSGRPRRDNYDENRESFNDHIPGYREAAFEREYDNDIWKDAYEGAEEALNDWREFVNEIKTNKTERIVKR